MSNVDTAKAAHEAFRKGDLDKLKDTMVEDIVWWSSDEVQPGGEHHGIQKVLDMFRQVPEHWKRFDVEAEEYIDAGDQVVVRGTTTIENDRGSDTARWIQVLTFDDDGKVTKGEMHSDTAKGYKLQH